MHSDAPLPSLPERVRKHAEKARTAAQSGDPDYAISLCETLLQQHPGCLEIRSSMREAQKRKAAAAGWKKLTGGLTAAVQLTKAGRLRKSDPPRALAEIERALTAAPAHAPAHRLLGEVALEQNLPHTAVFGFEGLCEQTPNKAEAWVLLGNALIQANRSPDAVRVAEKALQIDPSASTAQALLKTASVAQTLGSGSWQAAAEGTTAPAASAASSESDDATPKETRLLDDPAQVRLRLEKNIALLADQPGDFTLLKQIAADHHRLGEGAAAVEALRQARATPAGADDPALERLAFTYEDAHWRSRVEAADEAERAPLQQAHQTYRAEALGGLLERYPGDADFRLQMGETLIQLGRGDEAAPHLQAAQRDPRVRRRASLRVGEAFLLSGKPDLARAQFENLLADHSQLDDFGKELRYALADACEKLGDAPSAATHFKALYAADVAYRDTAQRVARYYQ